MLLLGLIFAFVAGFTTGKVVKDTTYCKQAYSDGYEIQPEELEEMKRDAQAVAKRSKK